MQFKCLSSRNNSHDRWQSLPRRYRYCIAIENSVAVDYVSEKVYDALVAGCLPIYLGAPNFQDFIPHPDAVIDLQVLSFGELRLLNKV